MTADFLTRTFEENSPAEAVLWKDRAYTYRWLLDRIGFWRREIQTGSIPAPGVVVLQADFSPNAIALFLALAMQQRIVALTAQDLKSQRSDIAGIAQAQTWVTFDEQDEARWTALPGKADSPLYQKLWKDNRPGLVLFSSGSTGAPKGVVHDLDALLEKFKTPRHRRKAILFLLFDHIGGINTLLYVLSNAGCAVTVQDRSPEGILRTIEKYSVEMLPTTPTFLNMLLLGGAYEKYDLKSLKLVTYGTEPMPESALKKFHRLFPTVELLQTYGLSELGILRSKSKSPDSLWVKVGGDGFQTRVVDGKLQIKARSAMLGYLNAPSPFTEDGWFITGDRVETDGDYIRILGRESALINVGGQKVNPVEVESVILEVRGIADAVVYGQTHYLLGNYVCADIRLTDPEAPKDFEKNLKSHCRQRLESYKVPVRIRIVENSVHSDRFKKSRNS